MTDPFRVTGPALVQFSGGRTSAYMLWRILQAHGGDLPADVIVSFQNTGRERPETLDFVRDCAERWAVPVVWLEYRWASPAADGENGAHTFAIVDHATASRAGEPFTALIAAKRMLPNPVTRFCTIEMKIRTGQRYMRSLGHREYTSVVGLRADEPRRVARARQRSESGKDAFDTLMPLATAGITKADVAAFWDRQNWDLALRGVRGATPAGNCDLCFLKSARLIMGLMRETPALARWWVDTEARLAGTAREWTGARFRSDRPSYAEMARAVEAQLELDLGADPDLDDCHCEVSA